MNYNQKLLKESLDKGLKDADFTYNKYREILDVCLAALEEPAQASEPTQTGLKDKFKNLIQYKISTNKPGDVKFEPFVPMGAVVAPDESKLITTEGMKKILLNSGYAVIDNEEFNENYIDVRTLRNQTGYEKWLFKKANEFRRNVLDMLQELYKNERITFEEYADNVASIDSWRIAMNSGSKKEQLDELYEGRLKLTRASGNSAAYVIETEIKDGYAEISERLNEIADKVNSLYPLVKRIDSDSYIIKSGLGLKGAKPGENKQANVNKTLDDYPLTTRQLQQVAEYVNVNLKVDGCTNINELVKRLKDEIAKDLKENRLKGKLY